MTSSPAKLDPNQTFFSNFPVNWTFQKTVSDGERGQQEGLEADADFASSCMMSRLTGGAGALPPWGLPRGLGVRRMKSFHVPTSACEGGGC